MFGPLVTVLLPTVHPWPEVAASLDSLLAQRDAPPFEIVLVDGHGAALPQDFVHPAVRVIALPGADSFALRAAGIAHASGEVIAVTEDHCLAPVDWVASIAAAHRADPSPAIVGAVMNHADSSVTAIDRANFLLTFAGQTPARLTRGLPVPTNVSFKRAALPSTPLRPGELEYRWLAELAAARALGRAPSVVLHHRQRWGRATIAVHFASGRSYGAAVHAAPMRARTGWWLRFPRVPLRLAQLVTPDLLAGAHGRSPSLADFVCMAMLIAANVCGQAVGALAGAGASRKRL